MERVCREKDERLYQPRIHSDRIKALHRIGTETGVPMTVLVDYFLGKCIEAYDKKKAEKEALEDEVAWNLENKQPEEDDDAEDLTTYLEPYQNSPYGAID